MNNFKDNLIALREIAMRKCADRINLYAKDENRQFLKENILVCLGTSPTNQKVIRTASKMAQAFHGVCGKGEVSSTHLHWHTRTRALTPRS